MLIEYPMSLSKEFRGTSKTPVSEKSVEILVQVSKVVLFRDPARKSTGDHFDQVLHFSSFLHVAFHVRHPFLQGRFRRL